MNYLLSLAMMSTFASHQVAAYNCRLEYVPVRDRSGTVIRYEPDYVCVEIKPSPSPEPTRETR